MRVADCLFVTALAVTCGRFGSSLTTQREAPARPLRPVTVAPVVEKDMLSRLVGSARRRVHTVVVRAQITASHLVNLKTGVM